MALTYRERFGLSAHQLDEEPAEAFTYWLEVERLRRKYQSPAD